MSSKHTRHTPLPSSPVPNHGSKFSKFLQRQSSRDRSKSTTDPIVGTPASPEAVSTKSTRKGSKFLGNRDKDEKSVQRTPPADTAATPTTGTTTTTITDSPVDEFMEEPPIIIEPIMPRQRTRSERPLSSVSDIHPSVALYSSTSTSRIGDLPTRLSGWLSHTFSTSSTDLSLPSLLSQSSHLSAVTSPKSKGSALLAAAKHGKGHLDKAVRYLLDSDSTPDKCTDPIWLLGVQHPGFEPPPPAPVTSTSTPRRSSADARKRGSPSSFRSSTSSSSSSSPTIDQSFSLSQSQPASSRYPGNNWPPLFYADFTSRIWLTYRSQFQPIRDTTLAALDSDSSDGAASTSGSPIVKRWNWGGEKGWSSDQGWGCMLRTGQSLLANALLHLHLGRDWRRPPYPVHTADYASYVQIITWFLDTPSSQAPFSVHRMALAGKELGKDVGQWFGPSTAAGAIKRLTQTFPDAGVGVAVAADSVVFQSDVFAASSRLDGSPGRHPPAMWGGRAVLVLIGVRLGLDGVNPVYYDTIKALYSFPQSVGIAGGRPSSSYYFVGSQADNLFYLDPHHARPAIPLRPPPSSNWERETTPESDREKESRDRGPVNLQRSPSSSNHQRVGTYPSSIRTGSSTFSYHALVSPSPLQQQLSRSSASPCSSASSSQQQLAQPRAPSSLSQHARARAQTGSLPGSPVVGSEIDHREFGTTFGDGSAGSASGRLDALQEHFTRAYSAAELKTFHCERVRKMPLSGLDPSMLIGFLCKDEEDWNDFRHRVAELSRTHKTIFSVQDEPPTWPSDSDDNMGLESASDDMDMEMDEPEEDGEVEQFFDTRSRSASTSTSSGGQELGRGKSEDIDTEDDPVDPITPGPGTRTFEDRGEEGTCIDNQKGKCEKDEFEGEAFDDDIEDDWVDPSLPNLVGQPQSPRQPPSPPLPPIDIPALAKGKSSGKKSKKGKKGQAMAAVPMMKVPTPPMNQSQQQHFPFPVTQKSTDDAPVLSPDERTQNLSAIKGKRMHTTRARDGGRTQSGGVKGVLPADDC